MKRVRLLAIDSHEGFWQQAAPKMRSEAAITVAVIPSVAPATLAQIDALGADVVAVDIAFPAPAAVELIGQLAWRSPAIPVIGLCDSVDDARLSLALAAGARACVARGDSVEHTCHTIAEVASGGFPLQQDDHPRCRRRAGRVGLHLELPGDREAAHLAEARGGDDDVRPAFGR